MPSESAIRDQLANNLAVIEPGLKLEKREKHLKNDVGASGFVDIFALDSMGRLVIIEIKKTNAAAREAVQELYKYSALLKKNYLVRATEVRLIVLSVEWNELLTPFSELHHHSPYNLKGGRIILDATGAPTTVEWVTPLPPQPERRFSRRHFIWEYDDAGKAKRGAQLGVERMKQIGLRNFIMAIVTLKAAIHGITHLVYFAQQQETQDFYFDIIKRRASTEELEEFAEWIEDFTDPTDRLGELADKAWDALGGEKSLYEIMDSESSQISHPEKAQFWFAGDKYKSVELIRVGMFVDDRLSDETLISELYGSGGGSWIYLDVVASVDSKPELDALLVASDEVFSLNSSWRTAARDIVQYAKRTQANRIRFQGFSNDDILKTIVWLALGKMDFTPIFIAEITKETRVEILFGVVEWNGNCPNWDVIATTFFDGGVNAFMMHRHFGSIRDMNDEIMTALGLSYALLYRENEDGAEPSEPIKIQNATISKRVNRGNPLIDILSCADFISAAIANEASFDMHFQDALEAVLNLNN